jgi:hypothetical protein
MAHWAELDENNIVLRVLVGDNNEPDEGYQWLIDNLGGTWVKTSYNSFGGVHYKELEDRTRVPSGKPHFRFNHGGIGFTYDEERDAFIAPKPEDFTDKDGNSFTFELNEDTCQWEAVAL